MGKNKVLAIFGIVFSTIALGISVVELVFCLMHKMGSIVLMPVLLIIVMGAVIAANIANLRNINRDKKKMTKGEQNEG